MFRWWRDGRGSRSAWWLAATAIAPDDKPNYASPQGFVDALYAGEKAALRPVHEAVVDAAIALGEDVIPTWDDSTPAMQRDWILWIESAKQAPTRSKRLGQTIEKLTAGKKRMY